MQIKLNISVYFVIVLLFMINTAGIGSAAGFNVELVGRCDTAGWAHSIVILEKYAYVADDDNGLAIIDITDFSSPTIAGTYDTAGSVWDVAVEGKYAYVAAREDGLLIVDVSIPSSPKLAGTYDAAGNVNNVAVEGKYVYITYQLDEYNGGLMIVDITNPSAPTLVGSYENGGYLYDISVINDYAYLADDWHSLVIVDTSNPSSPTLVGSYSTGDEALVVDLSNDYAYIASGGSGLIIVDTSDPFLPAIEGSYDTPDYADCVAVSENYAYVTDYNNGLVIMDITDPQSPTLAGSYATVGITTGVAVSDNFVYLADADNGLAILRVTTDSGTQSPSPSITSIAIEPQTGVYEGDTATIKVSVTNKGAHSNDGYISVSFPNNEEIEVSGTGNVANTLYPVGSTLSTEKGSMISVDPLAELEDSNWATGQTETLTIKVKPNAGSSKIKFYVRAALKDDSGIFVRTSSTSIDKDQQGWDVNKHSIDVLNGIKYPTNLVVDILSPSDKFKVSQYDNTIVKVKVTDNLGNPIKGSGKSLVQATFSNGDDQIQLFDDETHNDETADDGIYTNEWMPTTVSPGSETACTIKVSAQHSTLGKGTDEVSGNVKTEVSEVPTPTYEDLTIVHITDVHMGFYLTDSQEEIKQKRQYFGDAIHEINKLNPDLVVVTGDLVEYNIDEFFLEFSNRINHLSNGDNILCTPGNHDRRYGNGLSKDDLKKYNTFIEPFYPAGKTLIGTNGDYYITKGGYYFLGLDSGEDFSCVNIHGTPEGSGLTPDQITNLGLLDSSIPKIIFMHHPVITDRPDNIEEDSTAPLKDDPVTDTLTEMWVGNNHCIANNRPEFIEYCDGNSVLAVLTGHTHHVYVYDGYYDYVNLYPSSKWVFTQYNPPYYVQTQSLTKDKEYKKLEYNHGYSIIKLEDGKLSSITSVETSGKKRWTGVLACPANLHVYDSQGRHTGLSNGNPEGIPDSYYDRGYDIEINDENFHVPESIILYNVEDDYTFEIRANFSEEDANAPENQHFNFTLEKQDENDVIELFYTNVPLTENAIATLQVSDDTTEYVMHLDVDGDGFIDEKREPDSINSDETLNSESPSYSDTNESINTSIEDDHSTDEESASTIYKDVQSTVDSIVEEINPQVPSDFKNIDVTSNFYSIGLILILVIGVIMLYRKS